MNNECQYCSNCNESSSCKIQDAFGSLPDKICGGFYPAQLKSVRWILLSLNPCGEHITVRRKLKHGFCMLGGGSMAAVLERFGNEQVLCSAIVNNVLVLYVS